jgi:hypothetical protein
MLLILKLAILIGGAFLQHKVRRLPGSLVLRHRKSKRAQVKT